MLEGAVQDVLSRTTDAFRKGDLHMAGKVEPLETVVDELVELMVDTVCSHREMIRIAGDDYPAEVVKSRFLKLNSSHIEYVLDRMRENTTYVRNIKKYLLAALYNAPATIDSYYTSLVSHDMYGSGERR